jgi:PAS domain S-box-containing protein
VFQHTDAYLATSEYAVYSIDRDSLRQALSGRRNIIVEQWYHILIQAGCWTVSPDESHQRLEYLVDQCIDLLINEQFDRASAESIGSKLADWHVLQPEVPGQLQAVLLRAFTIDLPATDVVALMPNLAAFIGAFATGFTRQAQQYILSEQEQMLWALLAERRSVMEALRASEERLRTIVSNLPIIVFSIDRDGEITLAEGRGLEMAGLGGSTCVGQSIFDLPWAQPTILPHIRRALAGETFTDLVTLGEIVFETSYAPLEGQDGAVYGLIGVAMDVTERWRMQAELTEARYLISESREDERLRLAHDLHDGVVQELLGLGYQLTQTQRRIHQAELPDAQALEELLAAQRTVQQGMLDAVAQLRSTISALRPAGLEDLGLTTTLEHLVAQFEQEAGTRAPEIELDLDWAEADLPLPIARCLLRVAQEALRNALRHAQANHIAIILRIYEKTAVLHVIDDGVGFKLPPHLSQFVRAHHFGLVGLLEQVEYLYGSFTVWSEPDEGTEVTVELPLSRDRLVRTGQAQAAPNVADDKGLRAISYGGDNPEATAWLSL